MDSGAGIKACAEEQHFSIQLIELIKRAAFAKRHIICASLAYPVGMFTPGGHRTQGVEAAAGAGKRTEVFGYFTKAVYWCKIRVKGGECVMHRGYKRGINRRKLPPLGTGQVSTLRRHDDVAVSQYLLQYADNSLLASGDESKSAHPGMYDAGICWLQANRQ